MRFASLVALLAIVSPGLVGCGGGEPSVPEVVASTTAAPALDVCSLLAPADVGTALGQTVTVSTEVLGCQYASHDATAPIVSVAAKAAAEYAGGFDEAKQSLAYVIKDGRVTDLPSLAGGAVMDVGTVVGATQVSAIGFVEVGETIVQVNLRQRQGLSVAAVTRLMKATLVAVGHVQ